PVPRSVVESHPAQGRRARSGGCLAAAGRTTSLPASRRVSHGELASSGIDDLVAAGSRLSLCGQPLAAAVLPIFPHLLGLRRGGGAGARTLAGLLACAKTYLPLSSPGARGLRPRSRRSSWQHTRLGHRLTAKLHGFAVLLIDVAVII